MHLSEVSRHPLRDPFRAPPRVPFSSQSCGPCCPYLSHLHRYVQRCILGKGVGNDKNASEMRQKCAKMGLVLLGSCFIGNRGCVQNMRNTSQAELNGTCLTVHAGKCQQLLQFFAVFFAVFLLLLGNSRVWRAQLFAVIAVFAFLWQFFVFFCSFALFPARAIKRIPLKRPAIWGRTPSGRYRLHEIRQCKYLIYCIFPVLKPLACSRQSRCRGWTYKLLGGQKFSIKLSALSVGFPQRRPLNFINSPGSL